MRISLLCVLAALPVGCGKSGVEPAEVVGLVRNGNQPVTSGLIEFLPREELGTHGPKYLGFIKTDGHFTLVGPNATNGALPGHYTVTIAALPALDRGSSAILPLPAMQQHAVPTEQQTTEIPPQFSREQTSTITVEVLEGANEFDLDLSAYAVASARSHAAR